MSNLQCQTSFDELFTNTHDFIHAGLWQPYYVHIYVHLPKTAGMAFGKEMRNHYPRKKLVLPLPWDQIGPIWHEYLKAGGTPEGRRIEFVYGHLTYDHIRYIYRLDTPSVTTCFIRDPLKRILSEYNYSTSPAHPPHKDFKRNFPNFENFALTLKPNIMAEKLVGPVYNIDEYWTKLQRTYNFIGLQEQFDLSLACLRGSLGFGYELRDTSKVNTASARTSTGFEDVPQSVIEELSEKHRLDLEIFDMIQSKYDELAAKLLAAR
ncbi:MAG: hypothetical protein C0606_17385 [Hyphomicrobiales bacterium]|nr:MAG: hypothetical protein C0606_17385 [Hyphomicrobiales bacterium]